MLVFDATPLIYLATVDQLTLLNAHEERCIIPGPVYDEVVTVGVEAGYSDARRVEQAVDDDVFEVERGLETGLVDRLDGNPNLSEADASVIALADDVDGWAILDERYGRAAAEAEGVETKGTIWIVISSIRHGELTPGEGRAVVDEMIESGWYCSTDLYAKIVRRLEVMEDTVN